MTAPPTIVVRDDIKRCVISYLDGGARVEIPEADVDQVAAAIRHAYRGPDGIPWNDMALAAIKAWIGDL